MLLGGEVGGSVSFKLVRGKLCMVKITLEYLLEICYFGGILVCIDNSASFFPRLSLEFQMKSLGALSYEKYTPLNTRLTLACGRNLSH